MNTNEQTYTKEQHELIADLCTTYGIEPDQIVFFENDPEPIFDREATSILLHKLTDVAGIEDEPLPPPSQDAVASKYRVTFKDRSFAASSGVANLNEQIKGRTVTVDEARSLSIGRAARSALKNKGINLLKLHFQRKSGKVATPNFSVTVPIEVEVTSRGASEAPESIKTERARLIGHVHALGAEAGLINEFTDPSEGKITDKTEWYKAIGTRYGIDSCYGLDNDQLRDFAAYLKTLLPAKAA